MKKQKIKLSARHLLALNIRLHRVRKDWTQEELAHRAEVSVGYVSQIENETRAVSVDVVQKLADALGVPVRDLFQEA